MCMATFNVLLCTWLWYVRTGVQGMRWRLGTASHPPGEAPVLPGGDRQATHSLRALPHSGKIVCLLPDGQSTIASSYSLPASETRVGADCEPALWLSVGTLREGGVLQLRLEKMQRARERDCIAGLWFVYQPMRGALTLALSGT